MIFIVIAMMAIKDHKGIHTHCLPGNPVFFDHGQFCVYLEGLGSEGKDTKAPNLMFGHGLGHHARD